MVVCLCDLVFVFTSKNKRPFLRPCTQLTNYNNFDTVNHMRIIEKEKTHDSNQNENIAPI